MNLKQILSNTWATVVLALAGAACGGAQKAACSPEAMTALREMYSAAASDVISAGHCDAYTRVQDCPAYRALETHFTAVAGGLCQ